MAAPFGHTTCLLAELLTRRGAMYINQIRGATMLEISVVRHTLSNGKKSGIFFHDAAPNGKPVLWRASRNAMEKLGLEPVERVPVIDVSQSVIVDPDVDYSVVRTRWRGGCYGAPTC